jgi:DNA-binding transcriptional ArsR family regulator
MSDTPPITNINDPRWVRAISHPLRIRLLAILDEQAASPVMLATALNQPLGTVAYHVRVLYDLGLLKLVSTRQRRGATEHYYRTTAHPRFTDKAWAELDPVAKQRVLTAVLNKAHDYATRAAAAGGFDPADAHFTTTPLKLDQQGWTELAQATKTWLQATARIESESAERIAHDPHSQINAGLVILLFHAVPYSADFASSTEQPNRTKSGRRVPRQSPRTNHELA